MKIRLFYHSLLSDWNHGNAHFLRGVMSELLLRGHDVLVYEPADSWSRRNLEEEYGSEPVEKFYLGAQTYPTRHTYMHRVKQREQVLKGRAPAGEAPAEMRSA